MVGSYGVGEDYGLIIKRDIFLFKGIRLESIILFVIFEFVNKYFIFI